MLYVYVIICVDIHTYFRTMFIATSHRPHHGPLFRFHVEIHGLSPRYSANHHGTSVRKNGHVRYGIHAFSKCPNDPNGVRAPWKFVCFMMFHDVSWRFPCWNFTAIDSHGWNCGNWKQTLSVGTSYTKTHGSVLFRPPAWIAKAWLIFEWCHGWICLSPKVTSQWSWKAVYHSTSFNHIWLVVWNMNLFSIYWG